MSLLPLNPFSIKKQPVKKNEDEVQESCTPNQRCYLSWCVCLWLSLTIYLLVSFILELVGSSVAKRTAFELLLSAQQKGDICLPVADGEEGSWTPMGSTNGVFQNMLDASTSGIEKLFGISSTSSIALLSAANDRGLSVDPQKAWDNFNVLQSTSEFDMDKMVVGGLWGWLLKVLDRCGGAFSTGPILYTGLRNASSTMVNRAVETKQDGIPTWIWNDKVKLSPSYNCSSVYTNRPLTLLAYDNVSNRCLRDQYKVIYMEGFYKAPYSAISVAKEINDVVMSKLRSVSGLRFENTMDGCPGTLSGVLCPLWLAYMNATLITHAGSQWIGDRGKELTTAMSDWLYEGFHVDLFGYNSTAKAKTLRAAETLLCFYAQAARDSFAASDMSAAQTRWLKAAEKRNSLDMNTLWNYDSAATESLHNSLALGFQGAVGSTHALLDMWRQQQAGVVSPGQLACNKTMRHNFLRESLRRSSPGVPTMFATTIDGDHDMLHGTGKNQIRFKGGRSHVNLAAHSISHRHKMEWDNPHGFDMHRTALNCPFAKMAAYNPDVAHGGCGRDLTEEPNAVFASTDPKVLKDSSSAAHPFCKEFNEQNIFLINDSAKYDLATWHTSNNAYIPFGIGYRRCPGEILMWNTFDELIRDVDFNYNVHLLYPVDDAGEMERWALGTVPKNGLRMRFEEVSRVC
jgi:hypothetical protein